MTDTSRGGAVGELTNLFPEPTYKNKTSQLWDVKYLTLSRISVTHMVAG